MTWADWLLASVVGVVPILTRQFGAALVAMLVMVAFFGPWTKVRLSRFALGALLPILATLWQLNQGWYHSNWGAAFNLNRQKVYLAGGAFFKNLPWRPLVFVEYVAWLLIPLVIVAAIAAVDDMTRGEQSDADQPHRMRPRWLTVAVVVLAMALALGWMIFRSASVAGTGSTLQANLFDPGFVFGTAVRLCAVGFVAASALFVIRLAVRAAKAVFGSDPSDSKRAGSIVLQLAAWSVLFSVAVAYGGKILGYRSLMPILEPGFYPLFALGMAARWGATIFTVCGAALFARIFVGRYFGPIPARITAAESVLDWTTLFLVAQNLIFCQLWDEYLLVYLPYGLIVVGRRLEPLLVRRFWLVTGLCVLVLAGAAIWTRDELAKTEATWTLAERLRQLGVPPEEIFHDWNWLLYWQFEDYSKRIPGAAYSDYGDLYARWVPQERDRTKYRIVRELDPPPHQTWTVVDQYTYFSVFSRGNETYYAVRRDRKL